MLLSPSRSLGTRKKRAVSHQPLSISTGFFPELLLQKIPGGILPVQRTGWKPVPPMQLNGCNGWLLFWLLLFLTANS
jgi:hypothetical protein